ncbi:MAG TPA: hypothetical protein VF845_02965 [Terriglobales bacterium]
MPGKDFGKVAPVPQGQAATLWWSFSGAAKQDKTRPRPEEEQELSRMTFTGTLIEDLIAAVERAEAKAQGFETTEIQPWLASVQENANYDPKLLGVA